MAIGAGGVSVRRRWLSGWGLGIGDDREAAQSSVYDSFSFGWKVAVGERGGGLGCVSRDPVHETLDETSIPIFLQEPEANFGVVYEWVCGGVGEDELKKLGAIVQTPYVSLKIFDLLILHMRSNCQATVRTIGSWAEAWQAAMVINSAAAVPILRKKLAHQQVKEVSDRDLDIEGTW